MRPNVLRKFTRKLSSSSKLNAKDDKWIEYYRLGSKHVYTHHSPGTVLVDNVGYCLQMANGRKVVLPSTHAKSLPYPMKNTVGYQPKCEKFMDPLDLSSITFSHYKYPTAELIAFLRGMPTPLPESTSCAKYYFEAGHRKVTPYWHVYEAYFGGRDPKEKTVGEFFMNAIPQITKEIVQLRIDQEMIFVNLEPIQSVDHPLRQDDHLSSVVHVHERPVLDTPIEVLYEDKDVLVVNKPASMVIYPSNGYRLNTVSYILAEEMGHRNLNPVHRLDKLTSGVLIFAKGTGTNFTSYCQDFQQNHSKEYLALVDGDFPDTPAEGISCNQPLDRFQRKQGSTKLHASTKESTTIFHKLSTQRTQKGDVCTLVRCVPLQGRTHQIRIHLRQMGHPIVNDYLYNPKDEVRWQNNLDIITTIGYKKLLDKLYTENEARMKTNIDTPSTKLSWTEKLSKNVGQVPDICHTCLLGGEYDEYAMSETKFICLHSWKYRIGSSDCPTRKEFEAPLPKWACDMDFIESMFERRNTPKKWL